MPSPRVRILNVDFDPVTVAEASARVLAWARERNSRVVVTPNVDHVVQIADRPALAPVYAAADLVLADGQPLVWASRLLGVDLPERVAGSDLFPVLLEDAKAGSGVRVFLLGGMDGVAERAAERIREQYPWVELAGTHAPPFGFEAREVDNERAVSAVAAANADLVLVGLGAPKQELWVHRERARLACGVALCLGATIDFMAGTIDRAPQWMRTSGLEWLYRLANEPRRLARRYARDALVFPRLLARDALTRRLGRIT